MAVSSRNTTMAPTKANTNTVSGTAMECINGKVGQYTLASGRTACNMVMECMIIKMAPSMTDSGRMTNIMAMEYERTKTVALGMANG